MTLPLAVLDTNVVLDWFVFRNPGMQPVADAIERGSLRWVGCAAMRSELAHVLVNASLGSHRPDVELALTSIDRLMTLVPAPEAMPLVRPRCTDSDDQVFIDLALAQGARWLLSRDRAVLKLARKTRPQGLSILRPEDWSLGAA